MSTPAHGVLMPDTQAPHWLAYAVSQGMPEDMAPALTRDQIGIRLDAASVPLGGEPSLDRLERDPETRDARHRASWPAWRQQ
jgi:hypothetical protein